MWRVLEPYHAVTYFTPEARQAFKDAGLRGFWMGYFAGRAAPMGPVGPGVVTATFFGFRHDMVAGALPDAWSFASVTDVLAARMKGVDQSLRRVLGDSVNAPEVAEAAALARTAAEAGDRAGRPIFAANTGLPWPAEPHLALWQAATLLREHRGDGHVAALTAAGLDGCESHVSLVAAGALSRDVLQPNRGWTDEDWDAAIARLRLRGWLGRRRKGDRRWIGSGGRRRAHDRRACRGAVADAGRRRPRPAGDARHSPRRACCQRRRLPGPQPHRRLVIDGAAALAAAIRDKRLSAREAVDATLAAIEAVNPRLNAVVQLVPDRARAEAAAADDRLAAGERVGPLHGVPVTIKDCFATEGIVTTVGTEGLASFVPQADDVTVARLRQAGAIVVGKTNCPGAADGLRERQPRVRPD